MDRTLSDIFPDGGAARGTGAVPVLSVVLRANDPQAAPSRHHLDGIDVIGFGRGERAAVREVKDGLRRLTVRVPDPMMSSDHGRLVHAQGRWLLDDPMSKNGAMVPGRRVRSAPLAPGDVFALGHTVFLLDRAAAADGPADLSADELHPPLPELATFDPVLLAAVDALGRVAGTTLPVLVLGETGTGKEIVARALHALSQRRGDFVPVNCGAIAANLIEAELFGHRKGAFSGAVADRAGHLRSADRGTLFLDEVAELPTAAQVALLRALQERAVVPVGESAAIAVDFRLCAATHRDLPAMVAAGGFREDLYARLMGVAVHLPPLRARRGDLGLLIRTLLSRLEGGRAARFSPAAALALCAHAWPRNVRELERTLGAALALAAGAAIDVDHLPPELRGTAGEAPPAGSAAAPPGTPSLSAEDTALRDELARRFAEHDGNVTEIARAMGKDRTQIYRWLRRFGLRRADD